MNFNEMFPSNYLTQDDFATPKVLVIAKVTIEEIQRQSGKSRKPVVHFQGDVKPMVLNKTNGLVIAAKYGRDPEGWAGKSIEVYADPSVKMKGELVGGIRVRVPSGAKTAAAPTPNLDADDPPKPPEKSTHEAHEECLALMATARNMAYRNALCKWRRDWPVSKQEAVELEAALHAPIGIAPARQPALAG